MSNILITGGTGVLGKSLCALLTSHTIPFTIGSRRNLTNAENVAVMDLLTGGGVADAVAGKSVVIHLASDLKREQQVTQNLLKALTANPTVHLIYVSIVGIDKVSIDYYRQKLASERAIKESALPYSILRATQFHEFIDQLLSNFLRAPIGLLPKKALSQPIQKEVVAAELYRMSLAPASYSMIEIGGAETLNFEQLAAAWVRRTGKKRWIINLPLWGALGRSLHGGGLTTSNVRGESIRWEQWLQSKYATH